MAVFMPMTLPDMSTSGPPELPGLMAASVWMNFWNCLARPEASRSSMERFLAETMPAETVCERPKGLPMARTQSPTCAPSRVAELDGGEGLLGVDLDDGDVGVGVDADDVGGYGRGRRRRDRWRA